MSDRDTLLNSLKDKGWSDTETVEHLRQRLKEKLDNEEESYVQEIADLKIELTEIRNQLDLI